jgi:hypothetical protein
MIRRLVYIATVWLVLGSTAAHAERIALLPVTGVNVHEGYLQATQDLVRGHLEEAGYQVVPIPGPNGSSEIDPGTAVGLAQQVQARYAVVVHITRLGNSAKVKLTAYDAATAQVAYRGQLSAGSPDDMDAVSERLAKGMATGQPPADTGEIDTVTEKESDPLLKRTATNVFGVRIGVVTPLNRPSEGSEEGLPGLGVFWLYDVRSFLADISLDFHTKGGEGDFTVALGAYYPTSRANTTPYIGGGLRYGTADYGAGGSSGVSAYAGLGLLLGRLSTVQLRGEADFFFNLFREDAAGSPTRSAGLMLSAGIGF